MSSRMVSRRAFLLSTTLATATLATGCFGSWGLTRAVWRFNDKVSDHKIVKWIVFVALVIIPVYEVAAIVLDPFFFNVVEFFSGKSLIKDAQRDLGEGHRVTMNTLEGDTKTLRIDHYKDGALVRTFHLRRVDDEHLELLDENLKPLSIVRRAVDGSIDLKSIDGRTIHLDKDEMKHVSERIQRGASPADEVLALFDAAQFSGRTTRVAGLRGSTL